jgi:osmotically-inducible protein OsmY
MDAKRIYALNQFVASAPRAFFSLLALILALSGCATTGIEDPGSRSPPKVWEDQMLEYDAEKEIKASDPRFESAHLVIVSFNGLVLLVGEVESEELKTKAGEVMNTFKAARSVHNELAVSGPISMVARRQESWLTTKVKTKLVAHGAIDSSRINVTTENSVVYLLGIVQRQQAEYAVEVTQTVDGVTKIVKVFEYTD